MRACSLLETSYAGLVGGGSKKNEIEEDVELDIVDDDLQQKFGQSQYPPLICSLCGWPVVVSYCSCWCVSLIEISDIPKQI